MRSAASDERREQSATELVDELARVCNDPDIARMLAARAGLPPGDLPAFNHPRVFWTKVIQAAADGQVPGGVQAIGHEVAREYPGNAFLASYGVGSVRHAQAPRARARAASTGAHPHALSPVVPWWRMWPIVVGVVVLLVAVALLVGWPWSGLAMVGAVGYVVLAIGMPTRLVSAKELRAYREAVCRRHGHNHFIGLPSPVAVAVSWDDLYVDLTMEEAPGHTEHRLFDEMGRRAAEKVHLADAFRRARASNKRAMVLLGQPGSGKTTQLRQMLLRALERNGPQRLGLPKGTIPVFVALRELGLREGAVRGDLGPQELESLLREAMAGDLGISESLAGRILKSPGVLLLLDGLDEIPDRSERASVSKAIEQAQRGWIASRYVLVSSRYAGYVQAAHLDHAFVELRLRALDDEQVERLVHRWHEAVDAVEANRSERGSSAEGAAARASALLELLRAPGFSSDERLRDMARTPLLLTALCLIHHEHEDLPRDRVSLYEKCASILLARWREEAKKLPTTLKAKLAERVLQPVASWLHGEEERRYATVEELREPTEEGLREVEHERVSGEGFLRSFTNESGLLTQWGPELYGFIHLAFQEHLTALHLRRQWEQGSLRELLALAQSFGREWWREVILLMLAQGKRGLFERFMEEVVTQPQFIEWSRLRLMGRCVRESKGASAEPFMDVLRASGDHEQTERQVAAARVLVEGMPGAEGLEEVLREHPAEEVRRWWLARKAGGLETKVVCGVEMVLIPGGRFLMGSAEDDELAFDAERPQHEVELESFWLARTPVTNGQYWEYLKSNPRVQEPKFWGDLQQPVVGVSWHEARAFCRWAGFRLPTETQWEYACRAGTTTRYCTGDSEEDLAKVGWCSGNSDGRLHAVRELGPNAWGLYDMHGNVWEWCEGTWKGNYEGAVHRPSDGLRVEPAGDTSRVVRGGGFDIGARYARSGCRGKHPPGSRWAFVGFRPTQGHHQ